MPYYVYPDCLNEEWARWRWSLRALFVQHFESSKVRRSEPVIVSAVFNDCLERFSLCLGGNPKPDSDGENTLHKIPVGLDEGLMSHTGFSQQPDKVQLLLTFYFVVCQNCGLILDSFHHKADLFFLKTELSPTIQLLWKGKLFIEKNNQAPCQDFFYFIKVR